MLQAFTALHHAACQEDAELCQLLVSHGADIAARDSKVSTSLMADSHAMQSRRLGMLCIHTILHALALQQTHKLCYKSISLLCSCFTLKPVP